jgi:predicted RNA-binding Zn ribbon-like protein
MIARADAGGQGADAEFSFRSDRLALDFAATLMFRGVADGACELLSSPEAVGRWALASGLLGDAPSVLPAGALDRAIEVREAVYRAAHALIKGEPLPAESVTTLNCYAHDMPVAVVLAPDGALRRAGSLDQVMASIARDAVELFGGTDAPRVRQCARAGCTRTFVDRTRGQTRVWCGMRTCGNRVNAAAYRERRASGRAGAAAGEHERRLH